MALRHGKCLLRDLRMSRGMKQEDLSDGLNALGLIVSTKTISKYENDHQIIPPLTMRGICLVLNCLESEVYEWPK
ncbi:hypothetical protein B9T62_09385 [Paenibacillus donghaensis]|uniref:HTH cro/C1-type domain-containing protein n=1 Tax=Paenibacillus donghaensis TaxID=414771 RepID=A0A2Z2KD57_9BACL|nr:hypothetical protein B9T62_09385 [Paenibacillus donghaensis]